MLNETFSVIFKHREKGSFYSITKCQLILQRNKQKEHYMIKFILSVIHGDKPSSIDFAEWIKDGMVLMK